MAENNAVTKDDLKNVLEDVVTRLSGLVKETAAATEAKLLAEMDRRFSESQREFNEFRGEFDKHRGEFDKHRGEFDKHRDEVNKRLRRAGRQRLALRKEMHNLFYQLDGKIMNRFDLAQEHTDEAVAKSSREMTTKLDREAAVIDNFRLEQMTLGAVQDEMRDDLDETKKSHGAEIKELKRRVTVLEEEIFPASADKG